ncbi:MAG TPA: cation-efflux pump [Anaerolineales bacterium]|nr:cation-efflux pump [Anaerolineales bacterium]
MNLDFKSSSQPDEAETIDRYRSIRSVLLAVLVANLAVTLLKIIVGIVTGVLAVVADGFHSMVDSSSNLVGLAAISLARRPADERHPYGYQRYETLGSLAIGALMLVAAWEIASAIVERYLNGGTAEITTLSLVLVLLTFPVNVIVVILEKRAGNRLQSEILLSDARHTQTDLYVTGSVLFSLVGIWLGWSWLDLVVAGVVVALIVRSAVDILRDTSVLLADRIVIDPESISDVAYSVPGVVFIHHIRSRGGADSALVDLHVKVSPGMSTSKAHAIASEVERRLIDQVEGIKEVLVHIEPAKKERPTLWERISEDVRGSAEGFGLGIHDLHIHNNEGGGMVAELHLEFNDQISLSEAHTLADQFEHEVKRRWPDLETVITHLEPLPQQVFAVQSEISEELSDQIMVILYQLVPPERVMELQIFSTGDHIHAAITLAFPGEMLLTEVHELTEELETELRSRINSPIHVTTHVEPEEAKQAG